MSYMKQNKNRKETVESEQYELEIVFTYCEELCPLFRDILIYNTTTLGQSWW